MGLWFTNRYIQWSHSTVNGIAKFTCQIISTLRIVRYLIILARTPMVAASLAWSSKKGSTYFLQQKLTMGGTNLDLIDAEKGKKYAAKYHRRTFQERHKN